MYFFIFLGKQGKKSLPMFEIGGFSCTQLYTACPGLKVHKNENFFGFDFEFCAVSLLVMLKYEGFVKKKFCLGHNGRR